MCYDTDEIKKQAAACCLQEGEYSVLLEFLREEQIDPEIIHGIEEFRSRFPAGAEMKGRIPAPHYRYFGREIWE